MKHYLQTVHDTTFVVAAFSVLMLIVMAVAYVSLYNENVRLRKQVARTSNHPSATRAKFCIDCPDHEGCMLGMPCSFVRSVAAAEEAEYQLTLFDDHVDSALRLAAS